MKQNFRSGNSIDVFLEKNNFSIFRNVEISYLQGSGRGSGVEGDGWKYGCDGVGVAGARRVCHCRSRDDLSNDMLLEAFRRYFEELGCIQSAVEDGGFPLSNPIFGRARSH